MMMRQKRMATYLSLYHPSLFLAPPSHTLAMAEPLLQAWLSSFEAALLQRDVEAAMQLFHPDECFWRDLLAFTWNIYTAESQHEIRDMLRSALHLLDDGGIIIDAHNQPPITSSWKLDGEVEDLTHAYGIV